jgi:hypothetical protein
MPNRGGWYGGSSITKLETSPLKMVFFDQNSREDGDQDSGDVDAEHYRTGEIVGKEGRRKEGVHRESGPAAHQEET